MEICFCQELNNFNSYIICQIFETSRHQQPQGDNPWRNIDFFLGYPKVIVLCSKNAGKTDLSF